MQKANTGSTSLMEKLSLASLKENYASSEVLTLTFIIMILLVIVFGLLNPMFFTLRNFTNIFVRSSIYFVLGVGMTIVITSGGIDLSIGSQIALISMILGETLTVLNYPIWLGVLLGVLTGIVCGVLNAFFVSKVRMPPIVVTLGTMIIFRGIAYLLAAEKLFVDFPDIFRWFGRGIIWGIPVPVILSVIITACGYYFLYFTRPGIRITAVGSNQEAARLSGINIDYYRFLPYVIMGLLTAIASIMILGRSGAGQAAMGKGRELHTIAVVLLGGTYLFGGRGIILGTIMGSIILGILETGLLMAGTYYFWQLVATGFLIIIAVTVRISREQTEVK